MESIKSINQRLRNCEKRIKKLKEVKSPQVLIDNEERILELIKDNLKNRKGD